MTANFTPRLALTMGEGAGIGPDLCVHIAQRSFSCEIVVIGSAQVLQERARLLNLPLQLHECDFDKPPQANQGQGHLKIVPIDMPAPCVPGKLDVRNAPATLEILNVAHQLCVNKQCHAMVTAPVHKAIIAQSGIPFNGHTDYLAALCQRHPVLMSFYHPECILCLATVHLPLRSVATKLSIENLRSVFTRFNQGLVDVFKINAPNIGVCGLNPHAGEQGVLGDEEQTIIKPAIKLAQQNGIQIEGPFAADTLFTPGMRLQYDAIVAMYHDQGLAPMKALYFNQLVNITLGLPYLRTSVDHGTALDLAGSHRVNSESLYHAILAAQQFYF